MGELCTHNIVQFWTASGRHLASSFRHGVVFPGGIGAHLSLPRLPQVDRIPVAFKTEFGGATYRHIVLLTRHASRWGALGLSRKADLMHKPLTFAQG